MEDKYAAGVVPIELSGKAGLVVPDKQILGPGELGATIEWYVREGINDPNGKITEHVGPKPSESFVKQFMDFLWMMFANIHPTQNMIPVIDTGNVVRNVGYCSWTFDCIALSGSILSGIVVGTGNTAPTNGDYALGNIIQHDSSPPTAGRMQYGTLTFGLPANDASISQFTITRNFANSSGGTIIVNEIGLYVYNARGGASPPNYYYFMTIRDVIVGGIAVPNGQTLTVNYRPQAVV